MCDHIRRARGVGISQGWGEGERRVDWVAGDAGLHLLHVETPWRFDCTVWGRGKGGEEADIGQP